MTKRLIALIVAVVMVVSLVPMGIFAYDKAPADEILRQSGVYFDDAEWVALDGTPIAYIGNGGLAGDYTTETNPGTMSLLFEVKGVRTPVTFGKVNWNTLGTNQTTWIDSNNCGNYTMDTSFAVSKDGLYAVQFGFDKVNWVGSTFGTINRLTLFGGTRGVDFVSENTGAMIRPVGIVEANVSYDITFCDTDGTEIMNASGALDNCGRWSSRIDAVPSLVDLCGTLTKADTEQYRYEFVGWQTADGTPVDYATFCGKVYPIWKTIPNKAEPSLGDYYYDIKGDPVRIPTVAEGLNGVTVWEGDVDFGETGAGVVTFVIKATGINTPVSLSRFLPTYTMQNSINRWAIDNTWGGGNVGLDGEGTECPLALNIPKDGTYVISIGRKVFGMDAAGRVLTVSQLRVADINNSYKNAYPLVNDNENAQLSLLSISAGNPTFTAYFYDEDGTKIGEATKEYPKAQEANDSQIAKKTTCLTVDDMFALTGAELPTKEFDGTNSYILQWVDGEGNPVDAVYKNMNVYASYIAIPASQAIVTFLDARGNVMQSGIVDKGTNPVCADPAKDSTDDVTYTFAGWSVDGETTVDLASYVVEGDVIFTPVFVEDVITKASLVEIAPVKFGGTGTYGIKLNRTDVTLDAVAGVKAPISEGEVTVVTTGLTNDGKTSFTVPFDAVDEDGLTSAEFTLDAVENVSTSYTVTLSGTVMTEDLDEASIKETSETVAVAGQQVGEFYGEGEGTPINKNKEDGSKPDRQVLWKGNVATGGSDGVTFVYKLEGVETPINASNFNIIFNGSTWAWNSWNWQNGGNTGGKVSATQIFEEDGYFYMYVNQIPNGGNKYNTVNEFVIFQNPNDKEGPNRNNPNENATFRMIAVVADNLQPSLIFCDENGKEIDRITYKYTDLSGAIWSSNAKIEGELVTVGDVLAMSNVEAPIKASADEHTYTFDKWVYADGSDVDEKDPVYMNIELVAKYKATSASHSFGGWTTIKQPTCTEAGNKERVCSLCGEKETESIPTINHYYTPTTIQPTCTSKGFTKETCIYCGVSHAHSYMPALGHEYSSVVTEPSCTENGYTTYICSRCNDTYTDNYVGALGHSYGEWTTEIPATCIKEGSKSRICSLCGEKKTESIPTINHYYTPTTIQPTCTSKGFTKETCIYCGVSHAHSYMPALGHSYGEWETVKEPTCTDSGTQSRMCIRCDDKQTRSIPATGHNYTSSVVEPTCTEEGYTLYNCDNCGDSYTDGVVPALGHSFSEWTTIKEPNCTEAGSKERVCSACGEKETETIEALGHDYSTEWTVDVTPTCTTVGSKSHHCERCDSVTESTPIPMLAHTYDNDRDADCNVCGAIREINDPVTENDPQIIVESKKAQAGKTVQVAVSMLNNPGMWGMDLVVNYDRSKLTLTGVTNGEVFSSSEWMPGDLSGKKYILSYEANGFDNITSNGVLAILEFTVNENAEADSFYDISLSYRPGDIINVGFDEIDMAIVSGGIEVIDYIYGDLNGDGVVNKKDSLLLKMYLADNSTEIDERAADVYADGVINKKDSLYLKQYLAGYDVTLGE